MLYLLKGSSGKGKKYAYDLKSKADPVAFWEGKRLKNGILTLNRTDGTTKDFSAIGMQMQADCLLSAFEKYPYLPNVTGLLIFRKDFVEELKAFLDNQLQFFDMELITKDTVSNDYQIANITNTIQAFDIEKSDLKWDVHPPKSIEKINHLIFREDNCMNGLKIAREEFDRISVVVTEELKTWFEKKKVKEIYFLQDFEVRA